MKTSSRYALFGALAALLILGAGPQASAQGGGGVIKPGVYNCISGFRIMLTLGEITIKGNSYSFHPPHGANTTGTYKAIGPRQFRWTGDIGVIKNSQIVDSQFDGSTQTTDFWFTYHLNPVISRAAWRARRSSSL